MGQARQGALINSVKCQDIKEASSKKKKKNQVFRIRVRIGLVFNGLLDPDPGTLKTLKMFVFFTLKED